MENKYQLDRYTVAEFTALNPHMLAHAGQQHVLMGATFQQQVLKVLHAIHVHADQHKYWSHAVTCNCFLLLFIKIC